METAVTERRRGVEGAERGKHATDGGSRPTTPHADRVQRLSQRLSGIHAGLESERQLRDSLHQKIGSLDHRIEDSKKEQDMKVTELRKQMASLCENAQCEAESRKKYLQSQNKEIEEMNARLTQTIERQYNKQQESEGRCLEEFESKTNALRDELLKEHMDLVDTQSLIQQYCNVEIPKLHDMLRSETRERAEMEESCDCVGSHVAELLEREKKDREAQSQSMLHLIEQVVSKTQGLLHKEREERIATEGTLFQLLEDTISKLDQATHI
eukprot:GHVS01060002.1.p1 GENE.GHVS01060002.1~~GHVS01060002.1.p1  ORF type:complete len:269 (-),score=49.79 GHVS01060002.1:247-1053(-)